MPRTIEDIAKQIREREGEEAAKRYLDAVSFAEKREKEPPMWRRSSGELVPIRDMNNFHLRGALNIVHQYIEEQVEETGLGYLKCAPPVYPHLVEEAELRGINIPDFVDTDLEVPE